MTSTYNCSFALYIHGQLQRAFSFSKRDPERAASIRTALADYVRKHGPSGSGIDNGTKFNVDHSTPEKFEFLADFHHMNEDGFYDGWTAHKITATPGFESINIRIRGRDRNSIKDHLHEVYYNWLNTRAAHPALIEQY